MKTLGIHIGHDRGSSLISNGQIVANVTEERFARLKLFAGLPVSSINFCLAAGKTSFEVLDFIGMSSEEAGLKLQTIQNLFNEPFDQIIEQNQPSRSIGKKGKGIIRNKTVCQESPPLFLRSFNLNKELAVLSKWRKNKRILPLAPVRIFYEENEEQSDLFFCDAFLDVENSQNKFHFSPERAGKAFLPALIPGHGLIRRRFRNFFRIGIPVCFEQEMSKRGLCVAKHELCFN